MQDEKRLKTVAALVAAAYEKLPTQHIDPEAIAKANGAHMELIQDKKYAICVGSTCGTYPLPLAKVYQNDIRIDKDMLVMSEIPSYKIQAIPLDPALGKKIDENVSDSYAYKADGVTRGADPLPGNVADFYWREDNRNQKVEVYKIAITNNGTNPVFCSSIGNVASNYCPQTTSNLTFLEAAVGAEGTLAAREPNGQLLTTTWPTNLATPFVKDKSGEQLELSALKPGMKVNLIFGGYAKQYLNEIDIL
jgi:hypothetical protein